MHPLFYVTSLQIISSVSDYLYFRAPRACVHYFNREHLNAPTVGFFDKPCQQEGLALSQYQSSRVDFNLDSIAHIPPRPSAIKTKVAVTNLHLRDFAKIACVRAGNLHFELPKSICAGIEQFLKTSVLILKIIISARHQEQNV